MLEKIREKVRVATIFEPGSRIRPVWFDWNRRKHTITRVVYTWRERQGEVTLLRFAVTDDTALFELTYNTADQNWTLDAVEAQ
ncbi:MAG: hypothetical protein ED859_09765 [Desulfuromonadales bacterium]|nr:MAG: hypothetical protein ED859_09765 [Desulfuromonadales bacterium]